MPPPVLIERAGQVTGETQLIVLVEVVSNPAQLGPHVDVHPPVPKADVSKMPPSCWRPLSFGSRISP